mgnify:CR=1 FL=1
MNALLIGLLAVAVVLAVIRLLRGPTDADRVVAFDLLSACGIAACALAAAITGRVLYLDVALGVLLIGVGLKGGGLDWALRALGIFVALLVTLPAASHLLARAALRERDRGPD